MRFLYLLLGPTLLLPVLAVAQPNFVNTSAERNAARDARTAADAQRAARSSGNSSSNSNNSSSSRPSAPSYDPAAGDRLREAQGASAARDLEDRLEKSRQKQAELAREAEASHAQFKAILDMINSPAAVAAEKRRDIEKAHEARIEQLMEPLRQSWATQGFGGGVGHDLAKQTASYDPATDRMMTTLTPAHVAMQHARTVFVAQQASAPLDTLLALARRFEPAGYTAARHLQSLAPRFADRRRDIDLATLRAASYFWGKPFPLALTNSFKAFNEQAYYASAAEKQEMLDLFTSLLAKYPEPALLAVAEMKEDRNPFHELANQAEKQQNYAAQVGYYLQLLRVPYHAVPAKDPARASLAFWGYVQPTSRFKGMAEAFQRKGVKNPLAKFGDADWTALARQQAVPMGQLVGALLLNNGLANTLQYYSGKYTTGVNYARANSLADSKCPTLLKRLGLAGDADALNTYAVLVAGGDIPGQAPATAPALLAQAAAAGSAWAAVNQLWATSWGLPGYADRAAGQAKLDAYLASATPEQLAAVARILGGLENSPEHLEDKTQARVLAARAAAAGLPEGPLLVQELN